MITGPSNKNFWNSDFLIFPTFKELLSKILWKKLPGFKIDFESADKVSNLKFEICTEERVAS